MAALAPRRIYSLRLLNLLKKLACLLAGFPPPPPSDHTLSRRDSKREEEKEKEKEEKRMVFPPARFIFKRLKWLARAELGL